jgi:GGDEF domain-containing protein
MIVSRSPALSTLAVAIGRLGGFLPNRPTPTTDRRVVATNGRSRGADASSAAAADPAFAERFLAMEFAAALRGRKLSVVLFHIDEFDRIAQFHGVSRESLTFGAARALRRHTRAMNVSVPVAGTPGTFLSILSDVGIDGARVFVERVRREMSAIQVAGRSIAVSAGVAGFDHSMSDPSHLIRAAESALNRAVREGGNRVAVVVSKLTAKV